MDLLGNYTYNPAYGSGVYRRHIQLERRGKQLLGALEDTHHGFSVLIDTDGEQVTAITPRFHRIPFNTCDGADKPLRNLLGAKLNATPLELVAQAQAQINCTHLLDLSLWTIAHSQREEAIVRYEVSVTDTQDGKNHLQVTRNGQLIHAWLADNHYQLIEPLHLAGKPLFMGFSAWANASFSGIENEAAFVLQKGNLVSVARMFQLEAGKLAAEEHQRDVCHTYSPAHRQQARRLPDTVRDFSDCPEQLLRFIV